MQDLPEHEKDYSSVYVDHMRDAGQDPLVMAAELTHYIAAIKALQAGAIRLDGTSEGQQLELGREIDAWVNREFRRLHKQSPDPYHNDHKAFLAHLYRRAVERLDAGQFGTHFDFKRAARCIEAWVDSQFTSRYRED